MKTIKPFDFDEHLHNADWTKQTPDFMEDVMRQNGITRDKEGNIVKTQVPNSNNSGTMRGTEVVKGERALNGYRSYWLFEKGILKKAISAQTDEEADKLLNE